MDKPENISDILNQLVVSSTPNLSYQEDELSNELLAEDIDHESAVTKILSIFGGIVATFSLIGFLVLAGMDGELSRLIFGILFYIISIVILNTSVKTIANTFSITLNITSYLLISIATFEFSHDELITNMSILFLGLLSLMVTSNYFINYLAVLATFGSMTYLLMDEDKTLLHVSISLLTALMTSFILMEAKFLKLNFNVNRKYDAIRMAFITGYVFILFLVGNRHILQMERNYQWISGLCIIAAIIISIYKILKTLKVPHKDSLLIYGTALLICLPLVLAPAILGSLLVLILCFYANNKTGLGIGIVAFIYYTTQFYYDLEMSLIHKSIILIGVGATLIGLYYYLHQKQATHESN